MTIFYWIDVNGFKVFEGQPHLKKKKSVDLEQDS